MNDPIAIIGTVLATLLTAMGAILLFFGNYLLGEIKRLQAENKEDRETFHKILAGLTAPIGIILENEKEHEKNTKENINKIRALLEKIYQGKTK